VHYLRHERRRSECFICANVSNYFQNAQKGECFLHDFEALGCKIDVRALVLQNDLRLLCGREMPF
jgi:hypothetical protein